MGPEVQIFVDVIGSCGRQAQNSKYSKYFYVLSCTDLLQNMGWLRDMGFTNTR